MRMKTPNLARMRGMANPLSKVPKVNNASKIASMFSGGGGSSFGGSKLSSNSGSSTSSTSGGGIDLMPRGCFG